MIDAINSGVENASPGSACAGTIAECVGVSKNPRGRPGDGDSTY
jgi:hypothetical protein